MLVACPQRWDDRPVRTGARAAGRTRGTVRPVQTCDLRHFVEPCLLLLLRERPSHGYELAERLRALGFVEGDAASVYRTLRAMERDGLAQSAWRSSAAGPARRTYQLTPDGCAALDAVTCELRDTRRTLDAFLDRYSRHGAGRTAAG
jgi:PadR family transcriptional regulator, regulatory protein PadR